MKTLLLPLCALLLLSVHVSAKNSKVKFGRIEKEDLEMTIYDQDSSAVAVVLYENGTSHIDYSTLTNGWKLTFEKHQRIKILKKEGVEYADFRIGLHKSGSDYEELQNLKAITFNLEGDKIVENELERKGILSEEVNKYLNMTSFTLPNVKVGSVIDIKYEIDCKNFFRNMRPWEFQHEIPTIYSEYEVIVPEYFYFSKFTLGFENYSTFEETTNSSTITFSNTYITNSTAGTRQTEYENVNYSNNIYHWIAEDMPSFKKESYLSTIDNYIQQVQFELQSAKFPNSQLYNYSESWESINKNLIEDDDFGKVIFSSERPVRELTESLIQGATSNTEKVAILLDYLHKNFKFTGSQRIYSKGINKVLKDKNGNVADLNFLLALMLKAAGIESKPVVLSTRENGIFLFPTVTGFNYVVLQCELDGNEVLLDGASEYCGINEVPFKCLNGKGMVVGGVAPGWVDFMGCGQARTLYQSNLSIAPDGIIDGEIQIKRSGYAAMSLRSKIGSFNTTEKYIEDYAQKRINWDIEEHHFEGVNNTNEPVSEKLNVKMKDVAMFTGERIYLNPLIFSAIEDNPFKLKERKYPVDFGYKDMEYETVTIDIPEGYVIEEMPQSIKITMPGNKASYAVSVSKLGESKIQIATNLTRAQTIFVAEEYEGLKEFFNRIIDKNKEQIILKKI